MNVREKIKVRMDKLQFFMESNAHLKNPDQVEEHIKTVAKFWPALSDEDRDYIHGARFAIEGKMHWEV
jgi:hypothetical protein